MKISNGSIIAAFLTVFIVIHYYFVHSEGDESNMGQVKEVVNAEFRRMASVDPLLAIGMANTKFARPWECAFKQMPKVEGNEYMESINRSNEIRFGNLCAIHNRLLASNKELEAEVSKVGNTNGLELFEFFIRRLDENRIAANEGNSIGLTNTRYNDTRVGYFRSLSECQIASRSFLVSNIQVRGCEKALTTQEINDVIE